MVFQSWKDFTFFSLPSKSLYSLFVMMHYCYQHNLVYVCAMVWDCKDKLLPSSWNIRTIARAADSELEFSLTYLVLQSSVVCCNQRWTSFPNNLRLRNMKGDQSPRSRSCWVMFLFIMLSGVLIIHWWLSHCNIQLSLWLAAWVAGSHKCFICS